MQNIERIIIPEFFISYNDIQIDNLNQGRENFFKNWKGNGGNAFSAKALS